MRYTNSSLVAHTKHSPNDSGQRTMTLDRIAPHCVVGQCTAVCLGNWFAKSSTQVFGNCYIEKDGCGRMYVEEKNLFWCSSSEVNEQRMVTAGYDSDITEPYAFRGVRCSMWMDVFWCAKCTIQWFWFCELCAICTILCWLRSSKGIECIVCSYTNI